MFNRQIAMKFAECINVPKGIKPFGFYNPLVTLYIFSCKFFFWLFENLSVSLSQTHSPQRKHFQKGTSHKFLSLSLFCLLLTVCLFSLLGFYHLSFSTLSLGEVFSFSFGAVRMKNVSIEICAGLWPWLLVASQSKLHSLVAHQLAVIIIIL